MRSSLLVGVCLTQLARAQSATRDLTAFSEPGVPFTVSIALQTPPQTAVVAVEDKPPSGWVVSDISDGGSWDAQVAKVKWGLFFDPSIPAAVSYTLTAPGGAGEFCFDGMVSFDGVNQTTVGDACLSVGVPAVSQWALLVLTLSLLAAGTAVLRNDGALRAS